LKLSSKSWEVIFDLATKKKELEEIEEQAGGAGFWNDAEKAQLVMKRKSDIEGVVNSYEGLSELASEAAVMIELAQEEGDADAEQEAEDLVARLEQRVAEMGILRVFSGKADRCNAVVSINPGAGGTEAQDWAGMLYRMYERFAEQRGYGIEVVDYQPGEEAGIKSVTFILSGDYTYGYMKAEVGVHRLVRISPYDAAKRRHTSFASVIVYPQIDDDIEVEINEADLRVDTYRASGAGGQHVNKTDSAVRITHLPTKIIVQCQNERSQHKNRATAMKLLKSRLYELRRKQEEEKMDSLHEKRDIAWGSQIRSYVLQPYRMVKDHRTGLDKGNVDAVLDGDIGPFIEAFLLGKKFGSKEAEGKG